MAISDLMWWQWVIFLVPALMLLVGLPIWYLWLGRRPRIPKGQRWTSGRGGYFVTLVWHPDMYRPGDKAWADAAKDASWVVARLWKADGRELDRDMARVLLHVVPSDLFDESPYPNIRDAAAYATYTGAPVGAGIPMIVVRGEPDVLEEILRTGEPVIHELLHLWLGETSEPDKDRNHDAQGVWGEKQLQGRIRQVFARMLSGQPRHLV